MLHKAHRLQSHLYFEAKIMLAHTELLKETAGFAWSTPFFRKASRIVWNAFVPRQSPVFHAAHTSQHDLSQEVVIIEQDSRIGCDAVSEAMKKLPAEHRQILIMVCIEGARYATVADKLGVTLDTVHTRLSCARQELQNLLAQGA